MSRILAPHRPDLPLLDDAHRPVVTTPRVSLARSAFRLTPIPRHSDRDALLEKLYPRTDRGRIALPRRDVLSLGLSAAALAMLGVNLAACKDACGNYKNIGDILIEIFDVLAKAFSGGDAIPSQGTLLNDTTTTQKIKIATSLIAETADGVCKLVNAETSGVLDIPPGKHEVSSDGKGLATNQSGGYHVDLDASESTKPSSSFTVS